MTNGNLRGLIVPSITPIDDCEDVDEAALRKVLGRLLDAGVHGIFVGGSAGEGPLLTDAQWRRLAEISLDEVHGRVPVLAGVMDTSSRRVCEKVKTLRGLGCRYFVLTPSYYIAVRTPQEHLRLFGRARDAAGDMEMIAYNIPQCVGSALAVDTICDMARRGWIRCCKESSGDWAYLSELLGRAKDVGLGVLAGDEKTAGQALLSGARGLVPVCANYDPQAYLRLYEAGTRGDRDDVARRMARVELLIRESALSGPSWLAGVKYALAALGIGSGKPLSPLEPADAQRMARIDKLIAEDRT